MGVSRSGNELGLDRDQADSLSDDELHTRLGEAAQRFTAAGAHYVIDSVADLLPVIDDIERRIAQGERP